MNGSVELHYGVSALRVTVERPDHAPRLVYIPEHELPAGLRLPRGGATPENARAWAALEPWLGGDRAADVVRVEREPIGVVGRRHGGPWRWARHALSFTPL